MRYAIQRLVLLALFAVLLFGAAGRATWPRGWAYVVTVLLLEIVTLALLAVRAPDTLRRRGRAGAGVERFDRAFAVLWLTLAVLTPVIAGLDVRFGWSPLPWSTFFVGLVVMVPASLFGDWAMVENEHFEQFVRIQRDRDQRVVTTGPYRVVRHPGYLGAVLGALVTPLLLGSGWTFVPAVLVASLIVVRTDLEDRTLRAGLAGYEDYARRTRFRLVPWIW